MASNFYKYYSDAGTLFKIYVPDSIAAASGLELAAGGESPVPLGLTPRYALVILNTGTSTFSLQVPYATEASFTPQLGDSLEIGGLIYKVVGCYGESIS